MLYTFYTRDNHKVRRLTKEGSKHSDKGYIEYWYLTDAERERGRKGGRAETGKTKEGGRGRGRGRERKRERKGEGG